METLIQHDFLPGTIEDSLLDNRIIMITEPISSSIAKTVIAKILYLESKSDDTIKIYISSVGGDVLAGLSIIDAMEMCKCKVDVYCIGLAASMAFVILACATGKRKAYKHAQLLYHEVSSFAMGMVTNMRDDLKQSEKLQNTLFDLLTSHTKITREMLESGPRDHWMDAEEALKLGVIDEIISKKKD